PDHGAEQRAMPVTTRREREQQRGCDRLYECLHGVTPMRTPQRADRFVPDTRLKCSRTSNASDVQLLDNSVCETYTARLSSKVEGWRGWSRSSVQARKGARATNWQRS